MGEVLRQNRMLLQDFQFFNVPRLTEIFDKEQAYELYRHTQAQKEAAARQQVLTSIVPSCPSPKSALPGRAIVVIEA